MNGISQKLKRKPGRKKIANTRKFRYMLNLDEEDNRVFLELFRQSKLNSKSQFLFCCVFKKEIPVRIVNENQRELISELSNYNRQIRMLGVNYNNVVRKIYTEFKPQYATNYLTELVSLSTEIVLISKKVLDFIHKYDSENK